MKFFLYLKPLENMKIDFTQKPLITANMELLAESNIEELQLRGCKFIIGARLKSEPGKIEEKELLEKYFDQKNLYQERRI